MQTDQRPHALRVAGRYAKDTYNYFRGLLKGPTEEEQNAWLKEHHPWALPLIDKAIADALAEYRARHGKEAGRE
ncbi:hypothetical protein [Hymenobacter arizonensis]|uniref:Uncharacterized protein n=1 Tax=Hymenobacter arizonensis TaxID=1227077 RepID=A0A1I5Z1Z6_HYMAR|nr:hypothetical protein [Hymenobacter arizonensis]SFQ50471.1 hypothetical protein SAMN04515668_2624 [Hymenobacter arizonensis]